MKMTRRLPSKGLEKGCSVLKYVKGVPFFSERYTKGVPFLSKMVCKRVRVGPQGRVVPNCFLAYFLLVISLNKNQFLHLQVLISNGF